MRIWNVPVVDSIDFIKEMEVEADKDFHFFGSWDIFSTKETQDYLYINDDMLNDYIEDTEIEENAFWAEIALKVLKNNNIEQLLIDDGV